MDNIEKSVIGSVVRTEDGVELVVKSQFGEFLIARNENDPTDADYIIGADTDENGNTVIRVEARCKRGMEMF